MSGVAAADLPHTAVLTIRTQHPNRHDGQPAAIYGVTKYFRTRGFLVAFHRPNVLIVSGGYRALLQALADVRHEPWRRSLLLEATLCSGVWHLANRVED